MDGQNSVTTSADAELRFHLRPAQVDPGTHKTQLAFGAAGVFVCFIGIFFTLLHNPAYLLIALSAVVVAMIASELGGRSGSRIGGAVGVWAALLFLVSPLQAQTMAAPAAEAKLLCTALYLLSVFAYLRFRNTRAAVLLRLSLLSALASFFVRMEAATLPLTITLAEILIPLGTAEMLISRGAAKLIGNRNRTQGPVAHDETDNIVGTRSETDIVGARSETDVAGARSETDIVGSRSETDIVGARSETDVAGARSQTASASKVAPVRTQRTPPIIGVMLFWLVLFFTLTAGQLAPHMVPVMEGRTFLANAPAVIQSLNVKPLLLPVSLEAAHHAMIAGYALCGAAMVMQSGGAALPLRILLWLAIFALATSGNSSLMAAPVALGLAFAALPSNGAVSRKFAIIIAVVGALGLSLVAGSFAAESIHWVNSQNLDGRR